MIKWMCDVIGNQPSTEEKIKGVFQSTTNEPLEKSISESLEKFIGERGNLPTAVKEKIKQMGYKWSDSGGGVDSWYLGVQFDDFIEACSYLSRMSIIFCSAVESGMLRFKLQTWVKQKGGKENDQGEGKPNG